MLHSMMQHRSSACARHSSDRLQCLRSCEGVVQSGIPVSRYRSGSERSRCALLSVLLLGLAVFAFVFFCFRLFACLPVLCFLARRLLLCLC